MSKKRTYEGIEVRHERNCPSQRGARCGCSPSYRAFVYSTREDRKLRKTFRSLAEARAWRSEALVALRKGTLTATPSAIWAACHQIRRSGGSGSTLDHDVLRARSGAPLNGTSCAP